MLIILVPGFPAPPLPMQRVSLLSIYPGTLILLLLRVPSPHVPQHSCFQARHGSQESLVPRSTNSRGAPCNKESRRTCTQAAQVMNGNWSLDRLDTLFSLRSRLQATRASKVSSTACQQVGQPLWNPLVQQVSIQLPRIGALKSLAC
jgi:hypothetical protein